MLEASLPETPFNPALETLVAPPSPEVFDQVAVLGRVNGDRKMLDRFLRLFRERNAPIVDKIGAALVLEKWLGHAPNKPSPHCSPPHRKRLFP